MLSYLLLFAGAGSVGFWGAMHLVKTRPVVAGFEPLSADNRHVLTMEWIVEGVALLFVAALVLVTAFVQGPTNPGALLVFQMSALFLLVMAAVSLFTGSRAEPLPYKLCAPIFTLAALMIFLGGMVA